MSDKEAPRSSDDSGAEARVVRVAEVVDRQGGSVPGSESRDFNEAVWPAASAADAVNIAVTANPKGEPMLAQPPPPPGVKVITKNGTD